MSRQGSKQNGSKDSGYNMGRQVEIESPLGDIEPLLNTSDESGSSDESSDSTEETTFIS